MAAVGFVVLGTAVTVSAFLGSDTKVAYAAPQANPMGVETMRDFLQRPVDPRLEKSVDRARRATALAAAQESLDLTVSAVDLTPDAAGAAVPGWMPSCVLPSLDALMGWGEGDAGERSEGSSRSGGVRFGPGMPTAAPGH